MQQSTIEIFNIILSGAIILTQIFIVFLIISWLWKKNNLILDFIGKRGILFAFLASILISALTFFYSEVIGYQPCWLCWIQRIFLLADIIALGLSLYMKSKLRIFANISIGLSTTGATVSLYQYYGQIFNPSIFSFCSAFGKASCEKIFFLEFGYITIPMMSFTAFALIIILILMKYRLK